MDSLWFGEGADYSREDAYWLTAISGIPFGIPGELLQAEASVQRGMVYGLSQRYAWMPFDTVNPAPLWQWWDAFGIDEAEMLGYWMADCPVQTSHAAVKAAAYAQGTPPGWTRGEGACDSAGDRPVSAGPGNGIARGPAG